MNKAKQKYRDQKRDARNRNIAFEISFDDWYQWWLLNGVDKQTQASTNLCMCRSNDVGPYNLNNIYLGTRSENTKEGWTHRSHAFKFKKIQTPAGVFESKKAAAAYYNMESSNLSYWMKVQSDKFYFID